MANKIWQDGEGRRPKTLTPKQRTLHTTLVIGATGAVTSQTPQKFSGMTVSRAAAGRYQCVLDTQYRGFLGVSVVIDQSVAGGTPTTTDGVIPYISANSPSAATPFVNIQLVRASDFAVADPQSGWRLHITIHLVDDDRT